MAPCGPQLETMPPPSASSVQVNVLQGLYNSNIFTTQGTPSHIARLHEPSRKTPEITVSDGPPSLRTCQGCQGGPGSSTNHPVQLCGACWGQLKVALRLQVFSLAPQPALHNTASPCPSPRGTDHQGRGPGDPPRHVPGAPAQRNRRGSVGLRSQAAAARHALTLTP